MSPQNRDETGRFRPGESGNPGGRPKGLASQIRDNTEGGAELVQFYLKVFRGEDDALNSARLRMDAARWLTERGFGKPGDFGDEFADDGPRIVTFKIANPNDDFEDA